MNKNIYEEKLDWFKQNENPEVVLLIANNSELIKIIVAWYNLKIKPSDNLTALAQNTENEIWAWLWENAKFNLAELKVKTGVPYSESVLEQKIRQLISNRILYPDGTVNSFVQRYLRGEVAKLFEAKPKKTTRNAKN